MFPLLKVSPRRYYAWLKRPPSGRAQADALLKAARRADPPDWYNPHRRHSALGQGVSDQLREIPFI